MKYIKDSLGRLSKLSPIEPNPKPETRVHKCVDIKLILFDIYGTLLISGSGDVHQESLTAGRMLEAFKQCGIDVVSPDPQLTGRLAVSEYLRRIEYFQHAALVEGKNHPEVNILKTWSAVVSTLCDTKSIANGQDIDLQELAFRAECLFNPIYPMPYMKDVLKGLDSCDVRKGIISNAQFYTPIMMNYFLGASQYDDSTEIMGFEHELCVFSFEHLRAKPDIYLFELIKGTLPTYNIDPEQVLFVGNDMLNDVYPAQLSGFKTALFAGDERSLRLRQDRKQVAGIEPDFVIDDLRQLLEIVS